MTHLRVGVILGEKHLAGYRLFNQLALVSLLPGPAAADNSAPWIEVRQNSSFSLQDGLLARERNSFTSAKRLAAYHGSTLESQPIFTLCAPGNS